MIDFSLLSKGFKLLSEKFNFNKGILYLFPRSIDVEGRKFWHNIFIRKMFTIPRECFILF